MNIERIIVSAVLGFAGGMAAYILLFKLIKTGNLPVKRMLITCAVVLCVLIGRFFYEDIARIFGIQ